MKWILSFLLLMSCVITKAQTTIAGIVTNKEQGKPMGGISIIIRAKGATNILTYALTDDHGLFKLKFNTPADSIVLFISGISIKKQNITYQNRNNMLNLKVDDERILLKEIQVKPPKIRRLDDTLNYSVDQFTSKNDRTIADVLRKMPGIKVEDNGSITYNGKAINKFYIENNDLLEGKYGIATNNIEAKDVETIQVLENHQPIKALKNKEFIDDAAINLKLKASAKNVLVANAQLGLGVAPILWSNEIFGMQFGKSKQFMATYKGNNIGNNSGDELQSFYGADNNLNFPIALSIQSPANPQLNSKRYLLNRDNAFSLNQLIMLSKELKFAANVSYFNDHQTRSSYSSSENFLPGNQILVIQESVESVEKFHHLNGNINLNANKEKFFFDNSLKFSGDLLRNEYGSVENKQLIEQHRTAPYIKFSNNLSIIKNYKKNTFRVQSYNGYGTINDDLGVRPLLYPTIFNDPQIANGMQQSLTQKMFVSQNNIAFGISQGNFRQNYTVGANAKVIRFESALRSEINNGGLGKAIDSLSNEMNWNRYDIYLITEYNYAVKQKSINLKLPFTYISQLSNELISDNRQSINRYFFTPVVSAIYPLNLLWQLNARVAYAENIDGLENSFNGYIMQSYRYLIQNQGQLLERNSQSYNVGISYRHPITMIFVSLNGNYYLNRMNLLYGNEFQGFLSVKRTFEIPNTASGYNISIKADKGFDGIIKRVNISGGYNHSENTQLNQYVITAFNNKKIAVGAGLEAKFSTWADFRYNFQYERSKNALKNYNMDFLPISYVSQLGNLTLYPSTNLMVSLRYDYSFNSAVTGSGRLMSFADASIKYKLKKLEFNLEYNNIFNIRRYVTAAFSGIGSYYSSYNLRPTQVLLKIRFKIK